MGSGGDQVAISVICDAQGIVRFQTPAPTVQSDSRESDSDAWTSGEQLTPAVGLPLVKTYWFDHLDCDARELQKILRKAAAGKADRARVWMRVNEQQLIRAELSVTPLLDESGQATSLLVRTESTHAGGRRPGRSDDAAQTKSVRTIDAASASNAADPLTLLPSVPMLRIAIDGTVLVATEAFVSLTRREPKECINLPLSELLHADDRSTLQEHLATLADASDSPRRLSIEVRLAAPDDADEVPVQLSVTDEADDRLLITVHDLSIRRDVTALQQESRELSDTVTKAAAWTARMERWIDHAPIGLALYDEQQLVRSNQLFEEQHRNGDTSEQIEHLAAQVAQEHPIAHAVSEDRVASAFWIDGDADSSHLVGIAVAAVPPARGTTGLSALLDALSQTGRFSVFSVDADDRCVLQQSSGSAGSDKAPKLVRDLFHAQSTPALLRALGRIREGGTAELLHLLRVDDSSCTVTLSGLQPEAVTMVVEDASTIEQAHNAMLERLSELERTILEQSQPAIDPAEVRRLRQTAREQQTQLQMFVDSLGGGTFSWDVEAGKLDADEVCLSLLGLTPHAVSNGSPLTPGTLLSAAVLDDRQLFERAVFDALSPDGNGLLDLVVHIGETRRPLRILGRVFFDSREDGVRDPVRLAAIVLDRSRDRDGETQVASLSRTLQIRNAELNAIFECSTEAIRIYRDGVVRHNAAAAQLYGDRVDSFFDADRSDTPPARALAGHHAAGTVEYANDDGVARSLQINATPLKVDDEIIGAVSIDHDLTDLLRLETSLREREEQIAGLFQNTGVGLVYLDAAGTMLDANAQLSVLLGHSRNDLLTRAMAEFIVEDDRIILAGQIEAVLSGELTSCSAELRMLRRNGEPMWVQLTIVPRHVASERSIVALVQNINDLRNEQARATELSEQLEAVRATHHLLAGGNEGFVLFDDAMQIADANLAARRLLHLTADATTLDHLAFSSIDGATVPSAKLPWLRARRGKSTRVELGIAIKDDATSLRMVEVDASPAGSNGVMLRLTDVSDRHTLRSDLHRAQASLVEAHTLLQHRTQILERNFVSAVQQLGAAVAAAAPAAKALTIDGHLPSELRVTTQRLVDAFRVHDRLVQHYTDATIQPASNDTTRAEVDAHAIAQEALRLVTARFNVGGRLSMRLEAPSYTVRMDPAIVRHALWSVFAHAASQAARAPTTITSSNFSWDGHTQHRLRVTWPGKSIHTAELTLARSLVEAENGTFNLTIDETTSTATIEFPTVGAQSPAGETPQQPMRVLLIEDHDSTARVLTRQLTRLRCEVTRATTLSAATESLAEQPFDLLVCDLTLPDANIAEFVRNLASDDRPALPAIALRGNGNVDDDVSADGFIDSLVKPVDLNALATAIAKVQRQG